jgi:hypothetical protein
MNPQLGQASASSPGGVALVVALIVFVLMVVKAKLDGLLARKLYKSAIARAC